MGGDSPTEATRVSPLGTRDIEIYLAAQSKMLVRILLVALLLVRAGATTMAKKIVLTDPNAKCIDGSQAVMYVSPGKSSKFYIYHQGGGW